MATGPTTSDASPIASDVLLLFRALAGGDPVVGRFATRARAKQGRDARLDLATVCKRIQEAAGALVADLSRLTPTARPADSGDILAWDHVLVEHLRRRSTEGRRMASKVLQEARRDWASRTSNTDGVVWRRWFDDTQTGLRCWRAAAQIAAVCAREAEPEPDAARYPTITRALRGDVAGLRKGVRTIEIENDGVRLEAENGAHVAAFPLTPVIDPSLLRRGVDLLDGLLLERIIRGLLRDHHAFLATGGQGPLVYRGGVEEFARRHGLNGRDRAGVRAVLEALRAWRPPSFGHPALLEAWEPRGSGRRTQLRVTLLDGLTYGAAHFLPKGPPRQLLPVLPLPALDVPGVARQRRALLAGLQWEILGVMREQSLELLKYEGVDIAARIDVLAHRSCLTDCRVEAALAVWTTGPRAVAEPWLRPVGGGRLGLVDAGAQQVLAEGARATEAGRRSGRRSAAAKRRLGNTAR